MQSFSRLATAIGLTLLVGAALPLGIIVFLALDERPAEPRAGLAVTAPEPGFDEGAVQAAGQAPCRVTVTPGEDISAVVAAQPIGGVVCLARGVHRPFAVTRSVSAGVTVRGEGEAATIIQAQRADGVTVTDAERFSLAGVTVRSGTPAGIYAARSRGLALRGVRVQASAFGLHADDGTTAALEDVTLSGSADFGLLVRRGAAVTGERVRVLESRGIGVGVTDGAAGLTLRASEIGRADLPGPAEGMVLIDTEEVTLEGVSLRGGNPAAIYAARVPQLALREVQVEAAVFGVHIDDRAAATLEDVVVSRASGVGLLLQRAGTVTGDRVRVLETAGTGVSAINNAGALTLRDSEVGGTAAAGIFVGIAGCADLAPASLAVPDCFYADLPAFVGGSGVRLERVNVHDTAGTGVVLFPGVEAALIDSIFIRCSLTALFAWGATVDVSGSGFEDNVEHALEYRAYPDPRVPSPVLPASGTIAATTVRRTQPLPSGALGGGILAQNARLVIRDSVIEDNRAIGVSYQNAASGEVVDSRIAGNGGIGLCVARGSVVAVRGTVIAGNGSDDPDACGGG